MWDRAKGLRTVAAELAAQGVSVPAGWKLRVATGVCADGTTIVGNGLNPNGDSEAWLAVVAGEG